MKTEYQPLQATYYRTEKEWGSIYRKYAAKKGVPESRFQIMYSVYVSGGGITQTDICDGWSAPLQTINSCLKQMEKEGVIALYVDSDNRRKKRVRLTLEGEKIAAELVEPIMQAENASFSALTPAEQAQLLELTKRQLTVMKKLVDES